VWELVCHHSYKWHGIATDLSHYDSHGVVQGLTDNDFAPDGATPGSGAWRFRPNSRVAIATNPGWRPLVGLRVECVVRMPVAAGHRQILIEAHQSFRLYTMDRYLFGAFHGNPAVYPQNDWDVISTYKDGLQVPGYRVPLNQWVRLLFEHDGLTQMRLSVDGVPVTSPRGVLSGVPGVGPKGICIGNSVVDGDQPFPGDIDEVKVWRLDPRRYRNQFQDRPLDQATADCWARHVQSLRAALAEYPDCAKKVTAGISAAVDRWLRAIAAQGPETRQRFDDTRAEYAKLWRAGKIDGPEMRKLLRDWCAWLRLVGIDPDGDEQAQSLRQTECWKLVQKKLASVDCDPQVIALMRMFEQECGCSPPALGEGSSASRDVAPRSSHVR
jgi:hypothetical protein